MENIERINFDTICPVCGSNNLSKNREGKYFCKECHSKYAKFLERRDLLNPKSRNYSDLILANKGVKLITDMIDTEAMSKENIDSIKTVLNLVRYAEETMFVKRSLGLTPFRRRVKDTIERKDEISTEDQI